MKTLVQIRNGEQSTLSGEEKEELLVSRFAEIPSLIVALSGGADSAYLAWAANRALGERALSVTALSPSFSAYDKEMVEQFVKSVVLRHEFIETHAPWPERLWTVPPEMACWMIGAEMTVPSRTMANCSWT